LDAKIRLPLMPVDLLPELALVPSGDFTMGSDDADEDERPAHRVHLDDFLIAVHPVMQIEYERFVHDTGHRAPAHRCADQGRATAS